MPSEFGDGTIIVGDPGPRFAFCEPHGVEYCHHCYCDHRMVNDYLLQDEIASWPAEYQEDALMKLEDLDERSSICVYALGTPTGEKKKHDISSMKCSKHSKVNCVVCFNFGRLILGDLWKAPVQKDSEKEAGASNAPVDKATPEAHPTVPPEDKSIRYTKIPEHSFPELMHTAHNPHNLDFDYPDFLPFNQLPPVLLPLRGWIFLGIIVEPIPYIRPMYRVKDTAGHEVTLAFYLNSGNPREAELRSWKSGSTLLIKGATQHPFLDGQVGLRIEDQDLGNVKNLRCSIDTLKSINDKLCSAGNKACFSCGKDAATLRCAKCKTFYCTKDCQLEDWKRLPNPHKSSCVIIEHLRALNMIFV